MDDDVTVVAPVDVPSFPSAAVSMDANQDSAVAGYELIPFYCSTNFERVLSGHRRLIWYSTGYTKSQLAAY